MVPPFPEEQIKQDPVPGEGTEDLRGDKGGGQTTNLPSGWTVNSEYTKVLGKTDRHRADRCQRIQRSKSSLATWRV